MRDSGEVGVGEEVGVPAAAGRGQLRGEVMPGSEDGAMYLRRPMTFGIGNRTAFIGVMAAVRGRELIPAMHGRLFHPAGVARGVRLGVGGDPRRERRQC